jgi:hypothetical protein
MKRKIKMGDKAMETLTLVCQIASSAMHQRINASIDLARTAVSISVLAITALLSACSTSTPTVTSATQPAAAFSTPVATVTPNATVTSGPTDTPAVTSTPQQTAAPTSLDPCQLIPNQEASSLAGTTFGAGAEGSLPGGGKTCTYGSQSSNVFIVQVVQAPDAATANAAETQFLSDLQASLQQLSSEGLNVTQLPDFADGAVLAEASINAGGVSVNGSAFGFRKGTIFFGFDDVVLGGPAPSGDALQAEATTVLGRLP